MSAKRQMTQLDAKRFGPWAVVTGASSGIGHEFARQIAASSAMGRFGSPREPKPCPVDKATCPSLPVPGRI